MRPAIACVSLSAVTICACFVAGCGSVTTGAVPMITTPGSVVEPLVRVLDPAVLARRLTAVQPAWPAAAAPMPVLPPERRVDCRTTKCVALTFDDGPGPFTGRVLNDLARHGARATFFVVGRMIPGAGEHLLRRIAAEGHELGNHSWNHPPLTSLSSAGVARELGRTQEVVRRACGVRMRVMRPPYGATDASVAAVSRKFGLSQILWGIDTLDWRDRQSGVVARRAAAARPGEIVLLHDIHRSTADAVPRILSMLDAKGFTYVTVSELYRSLTPGKRYSGTAQAGAVPKSDQRPRSSVSRAMIAQAPTSAP